MSRQLAAIFRLPIVLRGLYERIRQQLKPAMEDAVSMTSSVTSVGRRQVVTGDGVTAARYRRRSWMTSQQRMTATKTSNSTLRTHRR